MPLALALLLALAAAGAAQEPPSQPTAAPVVTALVGGRVLTMTGEPAANATIVVVDGKVTAVGPDVAIPEGAARVDAAGLTILPGLIDCLSPLYLHPEDLADGTAIAASLRATDGLDLFTEHADEVLRAGVTTVHVAPGNRGRVGGVTCAVRVADATGAIEVLAPTVAVRGQIGVPAGDTSASLARLGDYVAIREALLSAQDYLLRQRAFERAMATFDRKLAASETPPEGGGKPPPRPDRPTRPGVDPDSEALGRVLRGELPLWIEAHRVPEILNALRLKDEFGLRLVLLGCTEGWKVADEIARRDVAVVLMPGAGVFGSPTRLTLGESRPDNAALLDRAGIRVALATGGPSGLHAKFTRAAAALAASGGMDRDRALAAVTATAARVLGLESRVGQIAEGRDADLLAIAGDPLDLAAPVSWVLTKGEFVAGKGGGR